MVKNILIAFLTVLFVVSSAEAQEATASLNKKNYLVGDYIIYTAKITSEKKLTNITPAFTDTLKTVEAINLLPVKEDDEDGKNIYLIKAVFAKYDSGEAKIPQLAVSFTYENDKTKRVLTANEVSALVSTVAVDTVKGIKDVKEPVSAPWDWAMILLIWLVAGVIITAVILFIFLRKKKAAATKQELEAILLPHERAFNQLNILENKKLWQSGNVKEYHTEITEIIRKYFASRFGFPALELTSGEALEYLKQIEEAKPVLEVTSGFLTNADMVKFAKFIPMNEVNEEMMKQAREIVELTMQKPDEDSKREEENVPQH